MTRLMAERLLREFSTGPFHAGAGEIIEADYVTLDCLPREERANTASVAPAPPAVPAGVGMLRGDADSVPSGRSRAGAIFWLFGIVLIAASFWIAGGHSLISR